VYKVNFNFNAALASIGLATPEPEKAEKANKRAESDAVLAARVESDVVIVRAWAIMCASLNKMGASMAQLPAVVLFKPTGYDLVSIQHTWADPTKDLVYVSHNRANRALKAVAKLFGDSIVIASARNGGDVVRTTPETKANGQGGFIANEKARQVAVSWANENAAAEIAAFVKDMAKIAKAGDNAAASAYLTAFTAKAAEAAESDALDNDQLTRYMADRAKPASKRRPMSEILGRTVEIVEPSDDDDETGGDDPEA